MDKHHILVVDDNHINRLFFETSLKKQSFAVTVAHDGFEALTLCQESPFDLILMDIRMNGMDGIQTAAAIKKLDQHAKTPILAISAEYFDHHLHDAFVGSLLKPIAQDLLQQKLQQYLSNDLVFNHQQALQVSNQDDEIVQKLRGLLLDQLPIEQDNIEQAYADQNWVLMDELLHKLLGSAKICAAELLFNTIQSVKKQLSVAGKVNQEELSKLLQAIEQTLQYQSPD